MCDNISGGRLSLRKPLRNIRRTAKLSAKAMTLGIDRVSTGIETTGKRAIRGIENVARNVEQYADVVISGRNDYPPNVRALIQKYGESFITAITIDRTPVPSVLTEALNAVSFGAFKRRFSKLPYDKLFHLRLDLTLANDTKLAVEKNEVINMYTSPKKLKGAEQKNIENVPNNLTLNKLLEGGQNIQGKNWFNYSAYNNNCQDFIVAILKGSNIGNEQDINFVKQNTESLFKGDSFLRKFANTVTDIGAKVNEITTGAGITESKTIVQSITFNKNKWTKRKAINWLKKHNFTGIECDETENTLRFRQTEPNENYNYITKQLPNEINIIIAYKKINNNNNYNNTMPKKSSKHYDSSSSDSDSDSDIEGRGFLREKKLIRKLKDIGREIEEHQNMHGGKIKIGKAFRKLGSTIKRGFEKEILKPAEKIAVPAANKVADYVTAKKGGLASDVITYGLPAASSALLGGLATAATGGNPVAGVAASALGSKLGSMGAKELKKQTGTGFAGEMKKRRGRPPKAKAVASEGDLVHIDIASHDASPMSGDGLKSKRRQKVSIIKNASMEQMVAKHREKEKDELMDALKVMATNINKEMRRPSGSGKFVKGSQEAKEHMAKIRAMRGKK